MNDSTNGAPERSLTPSARWGYNKKSATWERALAQACWCPDLGLSASRTVRNKLLLFVSYPICGILLGRPKRTKIIGYRGNRAAPARYPHNLEE